MNPGFTKTFKAGGAITAYRIVALGAANGEAVQAAAATDPLIGVAQQIGASGADVLIDVCMGDLPEVQYGAAVQRGDPLTADAEGKAVPAAPAAGETVRIIGYALAAGNINAIHGFQFAPGTLKG